MGVNGVEDAAAMYNINANAAAGIAGELKAARVLFLPGIRSVIRIWSCSRVQRVMILMD